MGYAFAMQLIDSLDTFLEWQQGRNFSTNTVRRRAVSVRGFARWLAPLDLSDATADLADEWLLTYRSPQTRHAYRSDLAVFYRWALRRRLVADNPLTDVDPIRVPKSLPRPVSPELVPALVDSAPTRQLRIALALAAYAGLRRSEIANLRCEDICLVPERRMLTVRGGKGGKDRRVYVTKALAYHLIGIPGSGPLFHVGPNTIGQWISKYLRGQGIDATAHQLRHSFCTEGARVLSDNLIALARQTGHESLDTLMIYVGWDGGEIGPRLEGSFAA